MTASRAHRTSGLEGGSATDIGDSVGEGSGGARLAAKFDAIIEVMLAVALVFMPAAFGAVEPCGEFPILILCVGMAITLAIKGIALPRRRLIWNAAYFPIFTFLLVALLQALRLPAGMVGWLSPHMLAMKRELLGDVPNSAAVLSRLSISAYPHATWHGLVFTACAATVFIAVCCAFRRRGAIQRLLTVIAVVGGVIAVIALAQDFSHATLIYWHFIAEPGQATLAQSGPFANHSHFGQFMNLSMGAALGLLLARRDGGSAAKRKQRSRLAKLGDAALVGMLGLGALSILISGTRGGVASMVGAGAFTALMLLIFEKRSRMAVLGASAMIVIAAAAVLFSPVGRGIRHRLLEDRPLNSPDRKLLISDALKIWNYFPIHGIGLGSHEPVFPMFDTSNMHSRATHVENEYVELLEEMGVVGAAIVACFAGMIWFYYLRAIRRHDRAMAPAAFGLGYGLLAVMIHSVTDFGQHVPAIAGLSAVTCGLLSTLAQRGEGNDERSGRWIRLTVARRGILLMVVLILCSWAVWGGSRMWLANRYWQKAWALSSALASNEWNGTSEQYARAIFDADRAAALEPNNVHHVYYDLQLHWKQLEKLRDVPGQGKTIQQDAEKIIDRLKEARIACPAYGPLYSLQGEIEYFGLGQKYPGAQDLLQGYQLAHNDPEVCLEVALMLARENAWDRVPEYLRQAVRVEDGYVAEMKIIEIFGEKLDRPDIAADVLVNTYPLFRLYGMLAAAPPTARVIEARKKVMREILRKCDLPGAQDWELSALVTILALEGRDAESLPYFKRLVRLEPTVNVYYGYAQALSNAGEPAEALVEVRKALAIQPDMPLGLSLERRLVRQLEAAPDSGPASG